MPIVRGQNVEVVRDARDGDYGWEKSLDQVIVRFPDTSEATVLRSELVEGADRNKQVEATVRSTLAAEDQKEKTAEGEDTREIQVKREETDREREARQGAGPSATTVEPK